MKSLLLLCVWAVALPVMATAQEARSTKWVNLRAGPARDYPVVARLGPGTPLAVQGCTEGFGWCDVIAPSDVRGWIYAGNIAYPYQSTDVPVLNYGAVIGFPIVTFMIGDYWGQHYRNRPWYGNESRWRDRPPMFRPRGRLPGREEPDIGRSRQDERGPQFRPPGDDRPQRYAHPPGGIQHAGGFGGPDDKRTPGGDRRPGSPGRPGDNGSPAAHPPAGGDRNSSGPGRGGGDRSQGGARPQVGGHPETGPGQPGRPREHRP